MGKKYPWATRRCTHPPLIIHKCTDHFPALTFCFHPGGLFKTGPCPHMLAKDWHRTILVCLVPDPDTHNLPHCRKEQVEAPTSPAVWEPPPWVPTVISCSVPLRNLTKGTTGGVFPDHCFSVVLCYQENKKNHTNQEKATSDWNAAGVTAKPAPGKRPSGPANDTEPGTAPSQNAVPFAGFSRDLIY